MELTRAEIKNLKDKKYRKAHDLFFVEGEKFCADILKTNAEILYTITTNKNLKGFKNTRVVDFKTLNSLASTVTPQQVLCVVRKRFSLSVPKGNSLILDRIQDPGNVGTLIRSALAFGFEDVFLLDSADAFSEKVVRASVGAVLNANIHKMSRAEFLKSPNIADTILVADMEGESIKNFDKPSGKIALIVGNEGAGVSDELVALATQKISIPMTKKIESLNAGVAGSIIMEKIFEEFHN